MRCVWERNGNGKQKRNIYNFWISCICMSDDMFHPRIICITRCIKSKQTAPFNRLCLEYICHGCIICVSWLQLYSWQNACKLVYFGQGVGFTSSCISIVIRHLVCVICDILNQTMEAATRRSEYHATSLHCSDNSDLWSSTLEVLFSVRAARGRSKQLLMSPGVGGRGGSP